MIGDDLSPFFVAGEFSDGNDTLGGMPVSGIFDGAYAAVGDGLGMGDSRPVYTLATTSVPFAWAGLQLVHKGVAYGLADHQPDGTGKSLLLLDNVA